MDCRVKLLQQDSGLQRAAFSKATGSRSPKDDHLSGKDCRIGAKQLEMLQAAVSRMASVGVRMKSYCITITTAESGFATNLKLLSSPLHGYA
jgi:hypothetical protein